MNTEYNDNDNANAVQGGGDSEATTTTETTDTHSESVTEPADSPAEVSDGNTAASDSSSGKDSE